MALNKHSATGLGPRTDHYCSKTDNSLTPGLPMPKVLDLVSFETGSHVAKAGLKLSK